MTMGLASRTRALVAEGDLVSLVLAASASVVLAGGEPAAGLSGDIDVEDEGDLVDRSAEQIFGGHQAVGVVDLAEGALGRGAGVGPDGLARVLADTLVRRGVDAVVVDAGADWTHSVIERRVGGGSSHEGDAEYDPQHIQ